MFVEISRVPATGRFIVSLTIDIGSGKLCRATIFGISWDWMCSLRFAWTDQVCAKETDWSSETGIYLIKFDLKGQSQKACLHISERKQFYPNWSCSVLILSWTGVSGLYSTSLIIAVTQTRFPSDLPRIARPKAETPVDVNRWLPRLQGLLLLFSCYFVFLSVENCFT